MTSHILRMYRGGTEAVTLLVLSSNPQLLRDFIKMNPVGVACLYYLMYVTLLNSISKLKELSLLRLFTLTVHPRPPPDFSFFILLLPKSFYRMLVVPTAA